MGSIFNVDGGVMRTLGKVTDCICLSIMFLVSCIPVITIGTAGTALYYTVYKVIRHDRGYIFREYVTAFKDNFKKTTPIWLGILAASVLLGIDISIMEVYAQSGSKLGILSVVFLVIGALLVGWTLYLFAYMARFENSRKQCMKNAALIAVAHLPWTVVLIALAFAASLAIYMIPLSAFLIPGFFVWIESYILEKIFWKYMSEEDRKAEEERNQEFKN